MKIAIVEDSGFTNKEFREIFRKKAESFAGCEIVYLPGGKDFPTDINGALKKIAADILITTDLQGFEKCTLTDNIAYNLADCRQIHLLLHEHPDNEHFLAKQLSISMFFYCRGDDYYEFLRNTYPEIPYLKSIPEWDMGTEGGAARADALFAIVTEVAGECGIC